MMDTDCATSTKYAYAPFGTPTMTSCATLKWLPTARVKSSYNYLSSGSSKMAKSVNREKDIIFESAWSPAAIRDTGARCRIGTRSFSAYSIQAFSETDLRVARSGCQTTMHRRQDRLPEARQAKGSEERKKRKLYSPASCFSLTFPSMETWKLIKTAQIFIHMLRSK